MSVTAGKFSNFCHDQNDECSAETLKTIAFPTVMLNFFVEILFNICYCNDPITSAAFDLNRSTWKVIVVTLKGFDFNFEFDSASEGEGLQMAE